MKSSLKVANRWVCSGAAAAFLACTPQVGLAQDAAVGGTVPNTGAIDISRYFDLLAPDLKRTYETPFRSDVLEIPLAVSEDPDRRDQLEYKVRIRTGGVLLYSWVAEGAPDGEFYFDLHSHTPSQPGQPVVVATFEQALAESANGAFTAPFDGIHGWYLQNQSLSPVKVRLRLAGYYELIPPGEPGNEARLLPLADR